MCACVRVCACVHMSMCVSMHTYVCSIYMLACTCILHVHVWEAIIHICDVHNNYVASVFIFNVYIDKYSVCIQSDDDALFVFHVH